MLRSILVALDDTSASAVAQGLAIDLATRHRAHLTGFAVLDRNHITRPTAVGIGGMAYKRHRDETKLEEAKAFIARREEAFRESCEAAGAVWQVIEAEGAPDELIERECGRHDLLVIGKDTDFHSDEDPSTADAVRHLMRSNPRPIVVCPAQAANQGPVLAAYDGSLQASRALHMLALLGYARERPVHVVSIARDREAAALRARHAGSLLAKHDYQVTPHGIEADGAPSDILLAQAAALGAALIAMGAYGEGGWRDFFLGSTTKRLLNACPVPLFVHH